MASRAVRATAEALKLPSQRSKSQLLSISRHIIRQTSGTRLFRSRPFTTSNQLSQRYGRGFNQQQFHRSLNFWQRLAARPTFYYECVGAGSLCAGFYIYNLETVPVTGRRRFNIVPESLEQSSGEQLYQQTLQQYEGRILPSSHPIHQFVQRVLDRLIPHTGLSDEHNSWEIHVVASPEKNAFVIPGGKVFVFTGILPTCEDESGLAAVLGHELAHNVAHHAAERMSSYFVLLPLAIGAFLLLGLGDFANLSRTLVDLCFLRPGSRAQESEADHIGLLMMAAACYEPKAAVGLWTRMDKEAEESPPEFMSTHPSNYSRREAIKGWLPQAEAKREEGACGPTAGWAGDFYRSPQVGFPRR